MSAAEQLLQEGKIEGRIEGLLVGVKLALKARFGNEALVWLEEFAPDGDELELMIALLDDEDIEFAEIGQRLRER